MAKLSTKIIALIASGATAGTIATQFLTEREDVRLTAYKDAGGIWTNCMGNTHNVDPNRKMTAAECEIIDRGNVDQAEAIVDAFVTVPLSPPAKAGVISFCAINIGPSKCRTSTFLRKLNARDYQGACDELRKWVFDGGKDCRLTKGQKNGCFGQVERRDLERELCLM